MHILYKLVQRRTASIADNISINIEYIVRYLVSLNNNYKTMADIDRQIDT